MDEDWRDLSDLGARVRAARGYVGENQPTFAKRLGISDRTLRTIEQGRVSESSKTPLTRLALAQLIVEETGCPPGLFGFSEPAEAGGPELAEMIQSQGAVVAEMRLRVQELRRQVKDLQQLQGRAGSQSEGTSN